MKNEIITMLESGEIQMTEDVSCMAGTIRMVLSNAKDKNDTETRLSLAETAIEILDAWIESLETNCGSLPLSEKSIQILSEIIKASKPILADDKNPIHPKRQADASVPQAAMPALRH